MLLLFHRKITSSCILHERVQEEKSLTFTRAFVQLVDEKAPVAGEKLPFHQFFKLLPNLAIFVENSGQNTSKAKQFFCAATRFAWKNSKRVDLMRSYENSNQFTLPSMFAAELIVCVCVEFVVRQVNHKSFTEANLSALIRRRFARACSFCALKIV